MFRESMPDYPSDTATVNKIAELLGVGAGETIHNWVHQADVDAGLKAGVPSPESAEVKRLRREVAELRRANNILKATSAFFAAELDRSGV